MRLSHRSWTPALARLRRLFLAPLRLPPLTSDFRSLTSASPPRRHRRLVLEQFEDRRLLTLYANDVQLVTAVNEELWVQYPFGSAGDGSPIDFEATNNTGPQHIT